MAIVGTRIGLGAGPELTIGGPTTPGLIMVGPPDTVEAGGQVLRVGVGQTYTTLATAIAASRDGDLILVSANFAIFRHRRNEPAPRQFIGRYRHKLKRTDAGLKIFERRAILDAEELGAMGAVSFLL